jgi:hypothetical protein
MKEEEIMIGHFGYSGGEIGRLLFEPTHGEKKTNKRQLKSEFKVKIFCKLPVFRGIVKMGIKFYHQGFFLEGAF